MVIRSVQWSWSLLIPLQNTSWYLLYQSNFIVNRDWIDGNRNNDGIYVVKPHQMGRTIPSFRIVLVMEKADWRPFCKSDRKKYLTRCYSTFLHFTPLNLLLMLAPIVYPIMRRSTTWLLILLRQYLSWWNHHYFFDQLVPSWILMVIDITVENKFHPTFMTNPYCF